MRPAFGSNPLCWKTRARGSDGTQRTPRNSSGCIGIRVIAGDTESCQSHASVFPRSKRVRTESRSHAPPESQDPYRVQPFAGQREADALSGLKASPGVRKYRGLPLPPHSIKELKTPVAGRYRAGSSSGPSPQPATSTGFGSSSPRGSPAAGRRCKRHADPRPAA